MTKYQNKYRIESARIPNYDYSQPNWYYVTINTKNHIHYFGKIEKEKMILNELGNVVDICWQEIPNHYSNTELDCFVIMPNHIHGIIIINDFIIANDKKIETSGNVETCRYVETCHARSLHNNNSNIVFTRITNMSLLFQQNHLLCYVIFPRC